MPRNFFFKTETASATTTATILPSAELFSDEEDTEVHQANPAWDCQVSDSLHFILMVMLHSLSCVPMTTGDRYRTKKYFKRNIACN